MAFEEHQKRRRQRRTNPRISIRKSGGIGINAAAVSEYFADTEAVTLLYDAETNRIGVKPADPEYENAYNVVRASESESASIAGEGFLNAYDLNHEQTTHYAAVWDEDAEMVVADLDDPVGTYGE